MADKMTDWQIAAQEYIKISRLEMKGGLLTLVFKELNQQQVDDLSEEVAEFLEDRLGTLIHVDV